MPLVSDPSICLRKLEYSETSQILTLLSRGHGIVRVLAKGAHRRTKAGASRFDGGVDLLDSGEAIFTDDPSRELATLTDWKLQDGHLNLRRDLRGLYLALYAAELVSLFFEEHDPHPQVFDATEELLGQLPTPGREECFLVWELGLLREAGFLPQLDACVECGTEPGEREAVYFSPARGGIICRSCEGAVPDRIAQDARLVRILQGMNALEGEGNRRLPRLTRHQTDPLNRLLAEQVEHSLGRRLRMTGYVLPPRGQGAALARGVAAGAGRSV
jgi:DNA repair protein RecO (recombination protein O)